MAPSPVVKICGITRLQDAQLAVELGAWAVGMIFYPASPRRCAEDEAQQIVVELRRQVQLCGVFVNATLDEVAGTVDRVGLTMVQLHGDEGPAYCAEVRRRTGALVIKAAQLSNPGDVRDLARFHVDYQLADARSTKHTETGLRGGTGQTFDWSLLSLRRSRVPLILSGGLHPGNVAEAVLATRPYAVDTASGTESAPGLKDPQLLRDFFDALAPPQPVEEPEPASESESESVDVEPETVVQEGAPA